MVKVSFRNGTTLEFDLRKEDDAKQWLEWSNVHDFQNSITGAGILFNRRFFTVPLPKDFKRCWWYAELLTSNKRGEEAVIGEKLICHADQVRLSLLVYTYTDLPPITSRMNLERVGKQVFPGMNLGGINVGR